MADQKSRNFTLNEGGMMTTQALNLPNGTIIVTKSKKRFTIVETLQISITRAVYVATLPKTEAKFVLKTESPHSGGVGIRMEKVVAAAIQCATPMEAERFSEFVDFGESKLVNFIVWKRLGPSLDELHQMYHQKFSLATSTRINVQTLRAISKLHNLGFIHRNIQPSHFVVGESAKRVIYLISFSLARPFKVSADGLDANRTPSSEAPSRRSKKKSSRSSKRTSDRKTERTTERSSIERDVETSKDECSQALSISRETSPTQQYFASRFWYTSDVGATLSRLDDIESWFYLSLHFINPESLPWFKSPLQMLSDIFETKRDLFMHVYSDKLFGKDKPIPLEYRRLIDEMNASSPNSTPDYEKIISIATKISHQACPNTSAPFDWEEKSP